MRRLALVPLLLVACEREGTPAGSTGPGITSLPPLMTGSTGSGLSSTSESEAEDSHASSQGGSSGASLDMGPPPDFGPTQPEGCKGKIDFMFLISSLGTMIPEQEQLLGSFEGFMATIQTKFADFDTHIMSVNVDGDWNGYTCEKAELCGTYGYCGLNGKGYVCGSHEDNVWACDNTLGAGLLFNAGPYATNYPCKLYGGNRYIIEGEPDPVEAFKCIATVGSFGKDPPMADSLVAAVSEELNGEGGCNEGFLRDDALLVFIFIMDNEDVKSWLDPDEVFDAVVAAKGGDPNSVVALAVIPQTLVGEPEPGCTYTDFPGKQHLDLVIRQFPYHANGDICAPNYAPFFDTAADLVYEACGSFIPQ